MPATAAISDNDGRLIRLGRADGTGPSRWVDRSDLTPPGVTCACAGCRRGVRCYSWVEPYRQAVVAPDAETRYAAQAVCMVSEAAEATAAAWLPVDSRGHTTGLIAYRISEWRMPPDRARRLYLDGFAHLDPFSPANRVSPDVAVVTPAELGGYEPFSMSHFAVGYLGRVGFPHPAVMNLRRCGRVVAQIFVGRSAKAGDFTPRHLSVLRQMHPFIEATLPENEGARGGAERGTGRMASAGLSEREVEVARLVATGATNRELADTLMVSVATVKSHLHHVFSKFDIRTRTELARIVLAEDDLDSAFAVGEQDRRTRLELRVG